MSDKINELEWQDGWQPDDTSVAVRHWTFQNSTEYLNLKQLLDEGLLDAVSFAKAVLILAVGFGIDTDED